MSHTLTYAAAPLTLQEVAQSPPLLRQVLAACIKQAASPLTPQPTVSGAAEGGKRPADEQQLLQQGYADVAATLLALAPLAFVPLDDPTLSSLAMVVAAVGPSRVGSKDTEGEASDARSARAALASAAAGLLREVRALQQRLAGTVNPRWGLGRGSVIKACLLLR